MPAFTDGRLTRSSLEHLKGMVEEGRAMGDRNLVLEDHSKTIENRLRAAAGFGTQFAALFYKVSRTPSPCALHA